MRTLLLGLGLPMILGVIATTCWSEAAAVRRPLSLVLNAPLANKMNDRIIVSVTVRNDDLHPSKFNEFWADGSLPTTLVAHVYKSDMAELSLTDLGTSLYHPDASSAMLIEGVLTLLQPHETRTEDIELNRIFVFPGPGMYFVRVAYGEGSGKYASSKLVPFRVDY